LAGGGGELGIDGIGLHPVGEQGELERILESVDTGADPVSVAGLEEDLQATAALKAWIRSKRADVAGRLAEGE
jgi:hypothetical protein